jgi:hypothetical protein
MVDVLMCSLFMKMVREHLIFFNVWLTVHLVYNCVTNQHDALFFPLYCVTTPLHVLGSFLACHQEAECMMWRMVFFFFLTVCGLG